MVVTLSWFLLERENNKNIEKTLGNTVLQTKRKNYEL
jgi:hypothetical protein